MEFIEKSELLNELQRIFGDLESDYGAYSQTENGHEWLSVKRIVDIINDCTVYED